MLTAPAGATVVNPITTLIESLRRQRGYPQVLKLPLRLYTHALGLPNGIDALSYDRWRFFADSTASAGDKYAHFACNPPHCRWPTSSLMARQPFRQCPN